MKKNLLYILCGMLLLTGCDYLNRVPEKDIETVETIFEQRENADMWLRGLYGLRSSMIANLSNVSYFGAVQLTACESHRNSRW